MKTAARRAWAIAVEISGSEKFGIGFVNKGGLGGLSLELKCRKKSKSEDQNPKAEGKPISEI